MNNHLKKYRDWVLSERGRSIEIAKEIGVGKAAVSATIRGKSKLPARWLPTIVRMSGGGLSYDDLVPISSDSVKAVYRSAGFPKSAKSTRRLLESLSGIRNRRSTGVKPTLN